MDKSTGNALKRARTSAGIIQEKAAEMSGYSVDSIQAWEAGTRRASMEVLDMLALCYNTPWVGMVYLREQSRSLSATIPTVQPGKALTWAVMELLDRINEFNERCSDRRLISIAADGKITPEERPEFDAILADLQQIIQAAMDVKYCQQDAQE